LQKRIKVLLLAPASVVVVVLQLASAQLANQWVLSVGQLHTKTGCFAAEQTVRAMDRQWQPKTIAARTDCGGIFDLCSDFNDVTQLLAPR